MQKVRNTRELLPALAACMILAAGFWQCTGELDQVRRKVDDDTTSPVTMQPDLGEVITPTEDMPTTPDPAQDMDAMMEDIELTAIAIEPPANDLEEGKRTLIKLSLLNDEGNPVSERPTMPNAAGEPEPIPVTWTFSDPSVAEMLSETVIYGLKEGTTTLTANILGVTSNSIEIKVLPAPVVDIGSVHITSDVPVLNPEESLVLEARVRAQDGHVITSPELEWHISAQSNLELDDETGLLTALSVGEAEVWASSNGVESERITIKVSDALTYPDVLASPREIAATSTITLSAEFKQLNTGKAPGFGTPYVPSLVEVVDGSGVVLGTLPNTDYGKAAGDIDISMLPAGTHTLHIRAQWDGQTIQSKPITLWRQDSIDTSSIWSDLTGGRRLGSESAVPTTMGDTTYLLGISCARECNAKGWSFSDSDPKWNDFNYQRQAAVWPGADDRSTTSDRTGHVSSFHLPRFEWWGWPSPDARDVSLAKGEHDTILVAFGNKDTYKDFNQEEAPEHYWYDCYLAEWSPTAGLDGQGGYNLLSPDRQDYLYNLPTPDTISLGKQRNPEGMNAERIEECNAPRAIARPDGKHIVAFLSKELPGELAHIRIRQWNGSSYDNLYAPFSFNTASSMFYDVALAAEDRPVIAIHGESGDEVVRWTEDGSWEVLELSKGLHIRQLYNTDDGQIFAAGIAHGDLQIYRMDGSNFTPLGAPLDMIKELHVSEPALLIDNNRIVVTWVEGPQGSRSIYTAHASLSSPSSWQVIGGGPLELNPDQDVYTPHIHVDAMGRVIVSYTVPAPLDPDTPISSQVLFDQQVRRSQMSLP